MPREKEQFKNYLSPRVLLLSSNFNLTNAYYNF